MRITGIYSTGDSSLGRSLLGFAVSPLASTLCIISAYSFILSLGSAQSPQEQLSSILGAVLVGTTFGAVIAYFGMLIVGVPTWFLLRFTGNESAIAYGLCGAAGGWLLAPIAAKPKVSGDPIEALGISIGALSLILFWRIARRRR